MSVPRIIRIERGSDGDNNFNLNKVPFCSEISEYQCFEVAAPKLALVPANRYDCGIK